MTQNMTLYSSYSKFWITKIRFDSSDSTKGTSSLCFVGSSAQWDFFSCAGWFTLSSLQRLCHSRWFSPFLTTTTMQQYIHTHIYISRWWKETTMKILQRLRLIKQVQRVSKHITWISLLRPILLQWPLSWYFHPLVCFRGTREKQRSSCKARNQAMHRH